MTDRAERPIAMRVLTPLQQEILVLVVNGLTNWEIADRLGLRPGLVGTHIGRITRALSVTSRADLVAMGGPSHSLSGDERQVLSLSAEGLSSREVGERLGWPPEGVWDCLIGAFMALGAHSKLEGIILAHHRGEL